MAEDDRKVAVAEADERNGAPDTERNNNVGANSGSAITRKLRRTS